MNPLNNPWATKEPLPEPDSSNKKEAPTPQYLGLRTELSKAAAKAKVKLVFEVRGLSAVPSGPYEIEYSAGATLRHYLRSLKFQHAATYSAIYDQNNLEKGRCRMSYVPTIDSRILVCNPTAGSAIQHQRSNVDAERVAANMGRRGGGQAPRIVTAKLK